MPSELVQKVRAKYPDAYTDLSDEQLEAAVLAKHPEYRDLATPAAPSRDLSNDIATQQGSTSLFDIAKGFAKGAANTVYQGGDLIRQGLGMERIIDTPEVQRLITPTNKAQEIGQTMETTAELIPAGIGIARAGMTVPGIVARAAGVSKTRAATNLASAADAAKNVAINAELPGQHALRIMQLGETGNYVPAVVRRFAQRVTDPNKAALTFEEARDYASTISKLSANEFGKLAPVVQREVGAMRQALQTALTEAAGTVGKAKEYTSGLSEYARSTKARKLASEHLPQAARTIGRRVAEGAGVGLGWKLFTD